MNLATWKATYPGLLHYSELSAPWEGNTYTSEISDGYLVYLNYIIDFPTNTNTPPRYAIEYNQVAWRGDWYTDGIAEDWNVTLVKGFVNGIIYRKEAVSMGAWNRMYMTFESKMTSFLPLLDTKGLPGNNFNGAPYKIYQTWYTYPTPQQNWDYTKILSKNPIRGEDVYFATDPGHHTWVLMDLDPFFRSAIEFELRGTFYDITPTPTPPPTPPPAPTYKNYLFLDVELGDSTAGLTANQYCIPIIN